MTTKFTFDDIGMPSRPLSKTAQLETLSARLDEFKAGKQAAVADRNRIVASKFDHRIEVTERQKRRLMVDAAKPLKPAKR